MPPEPAPRPAWARPEHIVGEMVPISFLLARSATAAVKIQHLTAYPNGFEFQLVAHYRPTGYLWDPMHGLHGLQGRRGQPYGVLTDEVLRFGIQFADGSKATNVGPPVGGPTEDTAQGPVLQAGSGSGGGTFADTTFWVWPLPPPGPVAFVCEWPKFGIPLTRHEIDANLIREASARAIELWPEESVAPGGFTASGFYVSGLERAPTSPRGRGPRGKRPRPKA
jgi:hypothetical protein